MRILVTGASGLLGLNLALEATKRHQVFGVVNNHPLRTQVFTVLQYDLLESGTLEQVIKQTRPDWVINCAALALVDRCEEDPRLAQRLNIEFPAQLASIVAKGGARLLHVSTDAVFDGQRGNYTEEDLPKPLNIYAQTKLEGEHAVAAIDPQAIIARVNFYGWSLSGERSLAEWFFNNLKARNKIMGFTDVFFCPLLVNDLARIFMRMLELELQGLFHVVSCEAVSKYEFGIDLAQNFGFDKMLISPVSVLEGGLIAARSPNLTLRTEKITIALGEPLPGIAPGLERFQLLYQQGFPKRLRLMAQQDHG